MRLVLDRGMAGRGNAPGADGTKPALPRVAVQPQGFGTRPVSVAVMTVAGGAQAGTGPTRQSAVSGSVAFALARRFR